MHVDPPLSISSYAPLHLCAVHYLTSFCDETPGVFPFRELAPRGFESPAAA